MSTCEAGRGGKAHMKTSDKASRSISFQPSQLLHIACTCVVGRDALPQSIIMRLSMGGLLGSHTDLVRELHGLVKVKRPPFSLHGNISCMAESKVNNTVKHQEILTLLLHFSPANFIFISTPVM